MKNKYILKSLIIAFGLLTISCSEWLKEKNLTQISSEYIYQSSEGLNVGLNALYNMFRSYERVFDQQGKGMIWYYCADDLGQTRTFSDTYIYKGNMNPINFYEDIWVNGYQLIDRANALISNAPKISITPAEKDRIVGEAKVLRAMVYFRLVQTYDNILLDTVATTSQNALDNVIYKPALVSDVYKLINSDLDFGINKLSYNVKPGQVGQALARHLRAQTAAWEKDWTTMALHSEEIINKSGLTLMPIDKVFAQDVNHKETIFAHQYDEILGNEYPKEIF